MKQEAQTTKELNNNLKNIKSHQNIPLKKMTNWKNIFVTQQEKDNTKEK